VKKQKFTWLVVLLLIFSIFFYSFRLTQSPSGMTTDEPAIGYNAILLEKTLHDETGRFLPIYILTNNNSSWKQPVTVYLTAIFFKIFGASLFNLKFVSVLIAVFSLVLIILINYYLLGEKAGIIAGLIYLSTPTVLMHSHLAQENIYPILFVSAWLIFVLLSEKKKKIIFSVMAGISLGLGIFCYKGMHALTPPLILITVIYFYLINKHKLKHSAYFILGIAPFILVLPWLNVHYAGSLSDNLKISLLKYYEFFYPYVSSFDLSALFIKGDTTVWHSTGIHGVFLLSTLPLFIVGLIQSAKEKTHQRFYLLLLLSFLLCPLLYGQVGSFYRFSRLLIFVPFYVSFCTLSIINIQKIKWGKYITFVFVVLTILNFLDFTKYYWYIYPQLNRQNFSENNDNRYMLLAKTAKEKKLTPYVYIEEFASQGDDSRFYEAAYFKNKLGKWKPGDTLPKDSLLMTKLKFQKDMTTIFTNGDYNYLTNESIK